MDRRIRPQLAVAFVLSLAGLTDYARAEPELLPVHEAFKESATLVSPRTLDVMYQIAPGCRLYQDRFAFSTDSPAVRVASVSMPAPLIKYDAALGRTVSVYADQVTVRITLAGNTARGFTLKTKAQGCAEIGLCYPPIVKFYSVPAMGVTRE